MKRRAAQRCRGVHARIHLSVHPLVAERRSLRFAERPARTSPGLTLAMKPTISAVMIPSSTHPIDPSKYTVAANRATDSGCSSAVLGLARQRRVRENALPEGVAEAQSRRVERTRSRFSAGLPPSATITTSRVVESASATTVAAPAARPTLRGRKRRGQGTEQCPARDHLRGDHERVEPDYGDAAVPDKGKHHVDDERRDDGKPGTEQDACEHGQVDVVGDGDDCSTCPRASARPSPPRAGPVGAPHP